MDKLTLFLIFIPVLLIVCLVKGIKYAKDKTEDRKKNLNKWLFAMIACVVISMVGIANLPDNKPKNTAPAQVAPKKEHSAIEAYTMSKQFVERRLKAPSTAKFPWYSENMVKDLGEGKYSVRAYVDSQNSFGAMIRSNYTCTLQYAGNDSWRVEELNIE